MKLLTLNINDNVRIDVDNSYLSGKEVIYYNQRKMSSKRTLSGGSHIFEVEEEGEWVRYEVKISIKFFLRTGIDIFRNNKLILMG